MFFLHIIYANTNIGFEGSLYALPCQTKTYNNHQTLPVTDHPAASSGIITRQKSVRGIVHLQRTAQHVSWQDLHRTMVGVIGIPRSLYVS